MVGGRAGGYERALSGARDAALDDMMEAAKELGANGIVGIDFDYEVMGETNGMMMVAVSGTASVIHQMAMSAATAAIAPTSGRSGGPPQPQSRRANTVKPENSPTRRTLETEGIVVIAKTRGRA